MTNEEIMNMTNDWMPMYKYCLDMFAETQFMRLAKGSLPIDERSQAIAYFKGPVTWHIRCSRLDTETRPSSLLLQSAWRIALRRYQANDRFGSSSYEEWSACFATLGAGIFVLFPGLNNLELWIK